MTSAYRGDRQGTAQILKETLKPVVQEATRKVAANVLAQDPDLDLVVGFYTTDRAGGSITIREPQGRLLAVRDGIFTRAAGAAGLEIRTRR